MFQNQSSAYMSQFSINESNKAFDIDDEHDFFADSNIQKKQRHPNASLKLILEQKLEESNDERDRAISTIGNKNSQNNDTQRYSVLIDPRGRKSRKNFILDKNHVSSKSLHKKMITEMFNIYSKK